MYRINQTSSSVHDSVLQKSKNYSHVRWLTVLNRMGAHWLISHANPQKKNSRGRTPSECSFSSSGCI